MRGAFSRLVELLTLWLERKIAELTRGLTDLTVTGVRYGCKKTRMAAVSADDLMQLAVKLLIGRIKRRMERFP